MVDGGRAGMAMVTFLMEVIGLTTEEVDAPRDSPPNYDIMAVLVATLPRGGAGPAGTGPRRTCPGVDLSDAFPARGDHPWLGRRDHPCDVRAMPDADVVVLAGLGHEAIDAAPELVVAELTRFLDPPAGDIPG